MLRTHTAQRRPIRSHRAAAGSTLAPPRAFGDAPMQAHAAGHDFARVAVRPNQTGLDDGLKAGIERLSGVALDDVRVHYGSPKPAQVQAAAFTQGTHIHVAPGQEQHLAHEAWHVVQQKQGRVRATGRVAGLPLNDSEHLEREASVMGRKALAAAPQAGSAAAAPVRQGAGVSAGLQSAPVQGVFEWLKNLFKSEPDPRAHYGSLDPSERYKANVLDRIHENERDEDLQFKRWARSYDQAAVDDTSASHAIDKAQTATTVGSGVIGKGAEGVGLLASATSGITTGIGAGASGLGVGASLLSAASGIRNLATDERQAPDKAITGGGVLSDLGTATTTAASGLNQASSLGWGFAKSAAPVLDKVAGPVAMARGGIDVVRGTAQAGLAGYRRQQLEKIEKQRGPYEGVARFGKQNQTTKVVGGVGTALGGGLALAGGLGIAGLALSNPIGWGLLAGAAGVGAGVAAYRKYRKHSIGKQLDTPEYREQLAKAGIHVPSDKELEPTSRWQSVKNFFTASTTSSRRYDAVRGHIGQKLAKNEEMGWNFHPDVTDIIEHMGMKTRPFESRPLVDDGSQEKRRQERAKNIAKAFEG